MISRRNYLSIAAIMAVLMFLFMFATVMKDRENEYDVNGTLSEEKASALEAWKSEKLTAQDTVVTQEPYVLFVGDSSGEMQEQVSRWCAYTRRSLQTAADWGEYPEAPKRFPEVVILESEEMALGEGFVRIREMEAQGSVIIFGSLEDAQMISRNQELQKFLGIQEVVQESAKLLGVKVFDGFLLGGEVVYKSDGTEEEEERQDFDLDIPWYRVGRGTKTYMVGIMEEEDAQTIENQDLPTLIWRNLPEKGGVFAICGDFMKDSTAAGILDGILAEAKDYYLYPVINAQNMSVIDFPEFADENGDVMEEKYSRTASVIGTDIIWPALESLSEQSHLKMTCFMAPQNDYLDQMEPQNGKMVFYLKGLKEVGGEAGLSLQYVNGTSLADKLARDEEFLAEYSTYKIGSVFLEKENLEKESSIWENALLKNTTALSCDRTEEYPIVSYYKDHYTLQTVTNDVVHYSYLDDLRMRSIQSALGYTNAMINIQRVFWPSEEADEWEVVQKRISSNLLTYWRDFEYFDGTTLSESDDRVRSFLNLDYTDEREDDKITVKMQGTQEAYFILRVHEEVSGVSGGSCEEIEKNTYLIMANEPEVTIRLKQAGLFYDTRK